MDRRVSTVEDKGPDSGFHWVKLIQEERDFHLRGEGQHGGVGGKATGVENRWAQDEVLLPPPPLTLPSRPSPPCLTSNRLRKKSPREEPSAPQPHLSCEVAALKGAL